MSRSSASLAQELQRELQSLETTRLEIERLVVAGQMVRPSAERMYSGLFLTGFTALEGFLENLFIGLVVSGRGLTSARPDISPRLTIKSHRIAREVIIGPGRRFVDWVPFDQTLDRSAIYFTGGRPFTDVSLGDRDLVLRMHRIRNAIAHRSRYSQDIFERLVIGSTAIPASERRPGPYLRGLFRSGPPQTRYEQLMADANRLAALLAR